MLVQLEKCAELRESEREKDGGGGVGGGFAERWKSDKGAKGRGGEGLGGDFAEHTESEQAIQSEGAGKRGIQIDRANERGRERQR